MSRWLRLALQAISLLLFGLILLWSGPDAWRQVAGSDLVYILASFLMLGAASMISSARLQVVARAVTERDLAPWSRFYYLTMTTRAVGLVVPRTLSTMGGKTVGLGTLGMTIRRAVWIVLLDSLFDVLLLGTFAAPALLFLRAEAPAWGIGILAVVLLLALAAGLGWITAPGRLQFVPRWATRIPFVTSILGIDPEDAPDLFMSRQTAITALGLTALFNALLAAFYYLVARAVGITGHGVAFVAGFPVTQLSLIVAVTPGGLGLVEAGWYGVLSLGGLPEQEVLTFVVAQRAFITLAVLLWAGISVLLSLATERGRDG